MGQSIDLSAFLLLLIAVINELGGQLLEDLQILCFKLGLESILVLFVEVLEITIDDYSQIFGIIFQSGIKFS